MRTDILFSRFAQPLDEFIFRVIHGLSYATSLAFITHRESQFGGMPYTPGMPLNIAFRAMFAAVAFIIPAQASAQVAPPKPSEPPAAATPKPTPAPAFQKMHWRAVGPASSGGRIAAVAGSASNPNLYYVGTAGGGVWKTINGGQTWQAVFGDQHVSAIGAVAIDPNNNQIVFVGTGETNPRNDVSYGDGLYKTTDGGKTWTNVGLGGTRHIARILIDPHNSSHVIVGALGDVFGDSAERGVYLSDDGGKTWNKTLYVSERSGASDLAMDMQHTGVIYAGMWQFRREPWTFHSGGEGGLYKSTDGGQSWTHLAGRGLPAGVTGRIGLAVAPSNGSRVYAMIESEKGVLWRSDDAGANWTMINNDSLVVQRPFYFSRMEVDSKDPDRLWALSAALSISRDGGKTFHVAPGAPHGDFHAMWIAPNDPERIIVGEDGGQAITLDGGHTWFDMLNMNIAQAYHVGLGNDNPYTICTGLQDNLAWCGASNSQDQTGIQNKDWIITAYGDGMWAIPDPLDANYLWSDWQNGSLVLYNRRTRDSWNVQPYFQGAGEQFDNRVSAYRFNWDSPLAFDPFDGHTAWFGGNVIFQTRDRGFHWRRISPDLTRNEKAHQAPSGGPITKDVSGAEYSDTILDIEGSALRRGEIWVGTDDGLVQLTRDGGRHWQNVTPHGVPEWGRVETVAPSALRDGTAYVNVDRHRSDDFKPYLFVTHDFGKHWSAIIRGLPQDQYVRSVRPDNHNPDMLYAGTENGMWISFDGGASWQSFQTDLPTASVRDIRIQTKFDDLAIATHGRSLYVMDNIAPLQQLSRAKARDEVLFKPRVAYEYNLHSNDEGAYTGYAADNPPSGVIIDFYQKNAQKSPPKIDIMDTSYHVLRTVQGTHKVNGKDEPNVSNEAGLNRYVWDFQENGPVKWEGTSQFFKGPDEGVAVPPGHYVVRLTLGTRSYTQPITIEPDPMTLASRAQMVEAYQYAKHYFRDFSMVDTMLNSLDTVKKQLDAGADAAKKKNDAALGAQIRDALSARSAMVDVLTASYQNFEDFIQRPGKIREDLFNGLQTLTVPITPAMRNIGDRIDADYRIGVAKYNTYVRSTVPQVNALLQRAGVKTVTLTRVQ
jgi:photosystem II stability/assembly factor-like uncharacterized protein